MCNLPAAIAELEALLTPRGVRAPGDSYGNGHPVCIRPFVGDTEDQGALREDLCVAGEMMLRYGDSVMIGRVGTDGSRFDRALFTHRISAQFENDPNRWSAFDRVAHAVAAVLDAIEE